MALFVIADLHLSLGSDKPMDIFPGWDNYLQKLTYNWKRRVQDGDTVVMPGDFCWAMGLKGAEEDFAFLHSLPGQKILLKGNHDYWWETRKKMDAFLQQKEFDSVHILFNDSYFCQGVNICGTRGWTLDEMAQGEEDEKLRRRELGRLKMSLESVSNPGEILVFLHYPPIYRDWVSCETIDLLHQYGVKRCFYGHLHSKAIRLAFCGDFEGIHFQLVSADALKFDPMPIFIE